ncbi:MAG TPA: ribonuclease H [Candidatus Binataceae bacterium]|nr:ribonuclease H [Candidatus Binataceae bacterium]
MADSPRKYVIYADGACIGNPGAGGWGAVIAEPVSEYRELSGGPYPRTTNNRMEMTAVIEGLRAVEAGSEVIVRSDSQYVVKTMTMGWKRNANPELWRDLDREVASRKVRFEWVRGHAGDKGNERADRLAASAAKGIRLDPASDTVAAERAESDLEKIEPLLQPGESIRRCARCGNSFVAMTDGLGPAYCSMVACQLKARSTK